MTCPYYKWESSLFGGDYYCIAKEETVDSRQYSSYCRDYSYSDCPIYKHSGKSSSSCYLTSACVIFKQLPDDCYELETLRQFRDNWLIHQKDGKELIAQYYELAPKIVSNINSSENRSQIYESIYNSMIVPCIRLIENKKFVEAKELYCKETTRLSELYVR